MTSQKTNTIRLAAVQMTSRVGEIENNLKKAAGFARQAAEDGAQLILFPELMPSGYTLNKRIWDSAEPEIGQTVRWLRKTSLELGVHLATSFIEAEGKHFYNTFVLTNPQGKEAGRIRKSYVETAFFQKGKTRQPWIDTELGRIGVGICADNHYVAHLDKILKGQVDLILMPHAWPAPLRVGGKVSQEDIDRQHSLAGGMARAYAELLGVPAVFCNQCGPSSGDKGVGLVANIMNSPAYYLPGLSGIADSDGSPLGQLGKEEGTLIADITLKPSHKKREHARTGKKWVFPGSITRDIVFGLDGTYGRLYYLLHTLLRPAALA